MDSIRKLQETQGAHPPIDAITDALSFRIARFNLLNERLGAAQFVKRFGITLNEWRVIGLAASMEKPSVSQIRAVMLIDKGQLSRVVAGLTERGLIVTNPSAEDKRVICVGLTDDGEALHAQAIANLKDRNEKTVACLSAGETAEFLRILDMLTSAAESRIAEDGLGQ